MPARHDKAINLMRELGITPESDHFPQKVFITNIHRGKGARHVYVYAELHDQTTNELLISGTLEYITMRLLNDKLHEA
jgi:hypothetical protein